MDKLLAASAAVVMGVSAAVAMAMSSSSAPPPDRAGAAEAEAIVKKAILHYQAVGKDQALADLTLRDGGFVDRDLHVTVYDFEGVTLAHVDPKLMGKRIGDLRDGKPTYHIKERIEIKDRLELARKDGRGWQELEGRFNPATRKIEDKRVYFERYDNVVFAASVYRK